MGGIGEVAEVGILVGVKVTACLYSGCFNYLDKVFVRGILDNVLGRNGGQRDYFVAIWSDNSIIFLVGMDTLKNAHVQGSTLAQRTTPIPPVTAQLRQSLVITRAIQTCKRA